MEAQEALEETEELELQIQLQVHLSHMVAEVELGVTQELDQEDLVGEDLMVELEQLIEVVEVVEVIIINLVEMVDQV